MSDDAICALERAEDDEPAEIAGARHLLRKAVA